MAGCNGGEELLCSQEQEAISHVSKYGGLVPKKKPLITIDHARAFFDSADWALGKQGVVADQKSRATIETLRPKLERTPRQQLPPRKPVNTVARDNLG